MEITIGHSNHTSYVNLLVQKCMLEHKYDMDCKQALITLIELNIYIHMCNQAYSSNWKRSIRYIKFLHVTSMQNSSLCLSSPYGVKYQTHHSTKQIPIDLLRVLKQVASKGLVNRSAS